ncbi:MAG: glycosyltransferase [Firmicutes bacterium]|nr:glycosyltransferase [Bacillota bacterium]
MTGDKVPFYYHLGDVFVSASVTETQGLTFMEAMASHRIVLSRFDENLSGVIKNNITGFFFTNEKDFGEKLNHIHAMSIEEKEKLLIAATETVDVYSIEHFYANIMEVYHRAIRQSW